MALSVDIIHDQLTQQGYALLRSSPAQREYIIPDNIPYDVLKIQLDNASRVVGAEVESTPKEKIVDISPKVGGLVVTLALTMAVLLTSMNTGRTKYGTAPSRSGDDPLCIFGEAPMGCTQENSNHIPAIHSSELGIHNL